MKVKSPAVVTCVGLTKVYHTGVVALNDLTLTIEPGMSFGLMGENGAGKSTLVRLLMGFIELTRKTLRFSARDRRAVPCLEWCGVD